MYILLILEGEHMNKFIYILIIALTCSVTVAKTTKADLSGNLFDIYKAPPESSVIKSTGGTRQCLMACFQEWRNCLNQNPVFPYWECKLIVEPVF